ncbi:glycosyl transferase [Diaporthe eres]|uniref:Alpha-1,3-glucosyltransferase n=1 Tax=Diaporthe eres TaxID=83184 RepID=A0ABR1PBA4_DIAER
MYGSGQVPLRSIREDRTRSSLWPELKVLETTLTKLWIFKSTDFEVHRNWLAITHNLPLREWYFEETSEWTLDYPPFFAYFEWVLSQVAKLVDPAMLKVYNLGYDSWQTVYFQRSSVLVTEILLVYALQLKQSGLLGSGLAFAGLLCMKHIYAYLAPAYFVYLLRVYCLSPRSIFRIQWLNCIKLGGGIAAILAAAFGPFALQDVGQLWQMKERLFPFGRGLCHAYWAPNVWALYSFSDRILIYLAPRLGLPVKLDALSSVTRGLVGDTSFAVLPDITPGVCLMLTLVFMVPPLVKLFWKPTWDGFIGAVTLCGYASFLFGYHVHEKAVLLVIIPFSLIALKDRRYFGAFRPLAVAGHVSLFPLLFTPAEFPIKTVYTIFWLILFLMVFDRLAPASGRPRFFLFDRCNTLYIAISIPLIAYCSLIHELVFGQSYEFLPLMFTSAYSALGVVGSWIGFNVVYFAS